MTHAQASERLDDFASGELPDIDRRLLQRHLDACDECRAEVEAIQALLSDAAALPRGIAPPSDLWGSIATRLEPRSQDGGGQDDHGVIAFAPRRRPWQPPRWLLQAAAAVVLVASSSALTAVWMRRGTPQQVGTLPASAVVAPGRSGSVALAPQTAPETAQQGAAPQTSQGESPLPATSGSAAGGTTVRPAAANPGFATLAANSAPGGAAGAARGTPTALAAFRPAEQSYQKAVDDLVRLLETRRSALAPETVATLERNLSIIDAAINESRVALQKDPNSQELTRLLSASYDAKVQMLRRAVEL